MTVGQYKIREEYSFKKIIADSYNKHAGDVFQIFWKDLLMSQTVLGRIDSKEKQE
jgi:hypothetical protein